MKLRACSACSLHQTDKVLSRIRELSGASTLETRIKDEKMYFSLLGFGSQPVKSCAVSFADGSGDAPDPKLRMQRAVNCFLSAVPDSAKSTHENDADSGYLRLLLHEVSTQQWRCCGYIIVDA